MLVYLKTAVMREKWCVPRIHSLQMSAVVRGISIKVENLKHLKDLICVLFKESLFFASVGTVCRYCLPTMTLVDYL